jgi:hypothetical protein
MTDNKLREQVSVFLRDYVGTGILFRDDDAKEAMYQLLLSAKQEGKREGNIEGLEEAAKIADGYVAESVYEAHESGSNIAEEIRSLQKTNGGGNGL